MLKIILFVFSQVEFNYFQGLEVSNSKLSAMVGCLRTRVRKQPIIALYFKFENEIKFYNLEARRYYYHGECVCAK